MSVRVLSSDGTVAPTPASGRQVAFIDTGLYDYQTLIEGVYEGIEVVLVAPDQDGIQVMGDWTAPPSGYKAVQVLDHGLSSAQQLGCSMLSSRLFPSTINMPEGIATAGTNDLLKK